MLLNMKGVVRFIFLLSLQNINTRAHFRSMQEVLSANKLVTTLPRRV